MDGFVDYYDLLGISPNATKEEIERAFRQRVRQLHPDVNPDPKAQELFQLLVEARATLTDPKRRVLYDREWQRHRTQEGLENTLIQKLARETTDRLRTTPFRIPYWDEHIVYSRPGLVAGVAPQRLYALTRWRPPIPETSPPSPSVFLLLVIDISRSMLGDKFGLILHFLAEVLTLLAPNDFVGLITFADRATLAVPPGPNMQEAITQVLREIRPAGATEFRPAIQMALEVTQHAPKNTLPWVLFITDGRAYDQGLVRVEGFPELERTRGLWDAYGLGEEWDEHFLEALAATGGGTLHYMRSVAEGKQAFVTKLTRLRKAYIQRATLEWDVVGPCRVRALVRRSPELTWCFPKGFIRLGPLAPGEFWELLWEWEWLSMLPAGREVPLMQGRIVVEDVQGQTHEHHLSLTRPVLHKDDLKSTPPSELVEAVRALTWHRLQEKARSALQEGRVQRAQRYLQFLQQQAQMTGNEAFLRLLEAQTRQLRVEQRLTPQSEKRLYDATRRLMLPAPDLKSEAGE